MAKLRINRALALAGAASRRGAEELVRAGRVKLNGRAVTDLATQVDPVKDKLELDGKRIKLLNYVYFIYYKPRGLITTMSDPQGRPCLGDVCAKLPGQPRPVGRLDRASEGLLLLTNDGDVAFRMTHPRYGVAKEYSVTVSPRLTDRHAQQMTAGIRLEDGMARFEGITLLREEPDRSILTVVVREGRTHLVRRVCAALGYEVKRLKRLRMGVLSLGRLKPEEHRQLSGAEVTALQQALGMKSQG
jgi:23S rRNA pseudouridine2605 synthase